MSNFPTRALYARKKQPPPPIPPPTPAPLFTMRFAFSATHHTTTTSEVLRTQKLRSSLLKTQNYQRLSFKPGVGQNIAFYASPAARNAILLMSIFPIHLTLSLLFRFKYSLQFVFPLSMANAVCCVAPRNKTGQKEHLQVLCVESPCNVSFLQNAHFSCIRHNSKLVFLLVVNSVLTLC